MSNATPTAGALTKAQKRQFVDDGFVVVEDAIDESVLSRARDGYWASLPDVVERDDPETWDETAYDDGLDQRPEPAVPTVFEALLREVYPFARDLIGPTLAPMDDPPSATAYHAKHYDAHIDYDHDGLMMPYPNYPGGDRYPDALKPHLDGAPLPAEYPDTYTPFNLVACVYLDRVVPGDGGLTAWPGSHTTVGEVLDGFDDVSSYHEELRGVDLTEKFELGHEMEITGPAGTVFLIHPALVHSVGANINDELRTMCLCRLAREDVEFNDLTPVTNTWEPFDGIPDGLVA